MSISNIQNRKFIYIRPLKKTIKKTFLARLLEKISEKNRYLASRRWISFHALKNSRILGSPHFAILELMIPNDGRLSLA